MSDIATIKPSKVGCDSRSNSLLMYITAPTLKYTRSIFETYYFKKHNQILRSKNDKSGKYPKEDTQKELKKIPAIVALSHPCNKLPMVAAIAANTAPLILLDVDIDFQSGYFTTKSSLNIAKRSISSSSYNYKFLS